MSLGLNGLAKEAVDRYLAVTVGSLSLCVDMAQVAIIERNARFRSGSIGGEETFVYNGEEVPLIDLSVLLDEPAGRDGNAIVLVLRSKAGAFALAADRVANLPETDPACVMGMPPAVNGKARTFCPRVLFRSEDAIFPLIDPESVERLARERRIPW